MRTLGVDLAADPRKTAACLIDWSRLTVEVTTPATDEDLVGLVGSVDLTGIDVPLGWPDEFVAAITEHHAGRSWPVADSSSVAGRERLRHRRTDVALRQAGDRPLSVSTDLIGVVALRAAGLQQRFLDAGLEVDRSGLSGSVAEVYPAAALRFWELPSRGYKGAAHAEERHAIVGLVLTETGNLTRAAELALDGCTSPTRSRNASPTMCSTRSSPRSWRRQCLSVRRRHPGRRMVRQHLARAGSTCRPPRWPTSCPPHLAKGGAPVGGGS